MSADLALILGLVLLCLIMCPAGARRWGEGGGEWTMGLSDATEQIDMIMIARACLFSKNIGGIWNRLIHINFFLFFFCVSWRDDGRGVFFPSSSFKDLSHEIRRLYDTTFSFPPPPLPHPLPGIEWRLDWEINERERKFTRATESITERRTDRRWERGGGNGGGKGGAPEWLGFAYCFLTKGGLPAPKKKKKKKLAKSEKFLISIIIINLKTVLEKKIYIYIPIYIQSIYTWYQLI